MSKNKLCGFLLGESDREALRRIAMDQQEETGSHTQTSAVRFAIRYTAKHLGVYYRTEEAEETTNKSLYDERDGMPYWKWWRDERPKRIREIVKEVIEEITGKSKTRVTVAQWKKKIADLPDSPSRRFNWEQIIHLRGERKRVNKAIQDKLQTEEIADQYEPEGYKELMLEMAMDDVLRKEAKSRKITLEKLKEKYPNYSPEYKRWRDGCERELRHAKAMLENETKF